MSLCRLTALSTLSTLPALALSLLRITRKLAVLLLLGELFHLLLQLFGLAAQKLLLIPLLQCLLLAVSLLLGQFLLGASQLFQFLQSLVDFLLPLLGGRLSGLALPSALIVLCHYILLRG